MLFIVFFFSVAACFKLRAQSRTVVNESGEREALL